MNVTKSIVRILVMFGLVSLAYVSALVYAFINLNEMQKVLPTAKTNMLIAVIAALSFGIDIVLAYIYIRYRNKLKRRFKQDADDNQRNA